MTLDPCAFETPCDASSMTEPYLNDLNVVLPLGWEGLSLDLPVRCWAVLRFLGRCQTLTFRDGVLTPDGEVLDVELRADSAGVTVTRVVDYHGPERRSEPRSPLQRRLSWSVFDALLLESEVPTPVLPDLAREFALLTSHPVHGELLRLRLLVGVIAGIGTLQSVSEAQDAGDVTMVEELLDGDTLDTLLFRTRTAVLELATDLPVEQLQAEYRGLFSPEAWATAFPDWLMSALMSATDLCQRGAAPARESEYEERCALVARLLFQLDGFADQEGLTDRLSGYVPQPLPAQLALRA